MLGLVSTLLELQEKNTVVMINIRKKDFFIKICLFGFALQFIIFSKQFKFIQTLSF